MNNKKYIFIILFLFLSSEIILFYPVYGTGSLGVFIGYSNSNSALAYSTNRKINVDASGRYWIGYQNGTQTVLKSSTSLTAASFAASNITAVFNSTLTFPADIQIRGNTIYACTFYNNGVPLNTEYVYFRTGNISGSSITWSPIRLVYSHLPGAGGQAIYSCSTVFDGTSYFVSWSTKNLGMVSIALRSTDNGITWGNSLGYANRYYGTTVLSMAAGKAMVLERGMVTVGPLDTFLYSYIWSGAAWGGEVTVNTDKVGLYPSGIPCSAQTCDGGFSAVNDGVNADIVHVAYIRRNNDTLGKIVYSVKYVYYQSGWQPAVTVQDNVQSTTQPTISYDNVENSLVIAWVNNSIAYQKTFYFHGNASWGSTSQIGNPSSPIPSYLIGMKERYNYKINYLIENGAGVPYNVTLLTLNFPTPPPALSGVIGCLPSNSLVNLTGKQTYIYIASSAPSLYINYTYLNVFNYLNDKGDAWVTVTLYGVSNSNPISSVNPLTALWQETTLIHNNTINTPIINNPNIETKENQYIGVAVSSTEDIQVNGTADVCNLYKYPVYAPYSIEYLITNATKIGLYAKYKQATPATTSFIASISTTTTRQYNIITNLNNIMVGMSIPPFFGYALFFMGTLFGSYIYIERARQENYINAGIPIIALVIIGFAVFSVYTLINGIPFELLIAVAVMIVGLFASLILGVFMNKDDG